VGQAAVTSVAMVFTELAINAVMDGALENGGGQRGITLTRRSEAITLVWAESRTSVAEGGARRALALRSSTGPCVTS